MESLYFNILKMDQNALLSIREGSRRKLNSNLRNRVGRKVLNYHQMYCVIVTRLGHAWTRSCILAYKYIMFKTGYIITKGM